MGIYHTRSALFNFLNGTRMRITLNKRDRVGMGATHPERLIVVPIHNPNPNLLFCNIYNSKYLILKQLEKKKKKK